MGFFSRKISATDKNDTHEMIDAKIHVMQHDLDEIAKNGRIEIESNQKEKTHQSTPSSPTTNEPVPSDSPFSQSAYQFDEPASLRDTPQQAPPQETPQSQQEIPSTKRAENISSQPTHSSAPLNLPTFHAAPVPAPRGPMHLNIDRQTPSEFLPGKPPEPEPTPRVETPPPPAVSQESLRTGTWPVESPTKTEPTKKTPKKVSLRKTPTDKKVLSDNIILKEHWGWKQYLLIIVILGSIFGGLFYFWKTRFSPAGFGLSTINLPNIPDISSNTEADDLRAMPDESLPFSTTNANPFIVDVETETVSTLRQQLMKNAETMRQAHMTGPVPFSVVDKTNTPIAFFIFASIFNLGLSGDLLNSLDNTFTLSLFLDNDEPRAILSITTKDTIETQKYLSASEKTLPLSLKNILLVDTPPSVPAATFATASYRDTSIRYFNLSAETPLSFDYAFVNNTLIIGTSKNAERAGIDTLLNSK